MLALLAAMTIAAAPEPVAPGRAPLGPRASLLSPAPTAACRAHGTYQAGWEPSLAQRSGRVAMQRLDDLPKANLELAVLRTVNGCAAPAVVAYSVGR